MKKYIVNQLTQISSWIGLLLILTFFWMPREYLAFIGVALFLTHDEWLKNWIVSWSPWVKNILDGIEEGLD